jgi:hypothetical protein
MLILLGFVVYLVPTIIAAAFQKRAIGGIFLLNLLLGWTVIGWVWAFIWALAGERNAQPIYVASQATPIDTSFSVHCGDCGAMALARPGDSKVCAACGGENMSRIR